jgi:hypothetical protein
MKYIHPQIMAGKAVAQFLEALRYKPGDPGFEISLI